jgi:uncharacterized membrane protein HdeD (DUF308 family)
VTVVTTAQKVGNEFDEVSIGGSRPKHRHWKLELVEGAILVVLGCVAGFVPFGFGIAIFMWLMVVGGITGLITTLVMRKAPGFWWSLASATLAIGIATVMFAVPELAVVGLPLLLMCFLVLEGIVTVMLALEHWRHLSSRWGWMLASGLVDLSLAVFIVVGLPATASWTLGLILAVNLIFGGGAMTGMALAARER